MGFILDWGDEPTDTMVDEPDVIYMMGLQLVDEDELPKEELEWSD